MVRLASIAALLSLLVACFTSGHTQTVKVLREGEGTVTMGMPSVVIAPKISQEGAAARGWHPVLPIAMDLGYSRGATDWLTLGARVKLGLVFGGEAGARMRLLAAGPLHLGLGGDVGAATTWHPEDYQLAWTHGRALWALDLDHTLSAVGSANLGLWNPGPDQVLIRGFSLGVHARGVDLAGSSGYGTVLVHTDWRGDEGVMLRLALGYEIPI